MHLSVDGCVYLFNFLKITNNTPMVICVQILCTHMFLFLLSRYLLVELLAYMVTTYLT